MNEQRNFHYNSELGLSSLDAVYVDFAYPRHSHEHYVICLIEQGVQSFTHKGTKFITPPSGLILINPDVVHTGEAATPQGFHLRAIYPTIAHMKTAVSQLIPTRHKALPYFKDVRVDDPVMAQRIKALHNALLDETNPLATESYFIATMVELIKRYGELCLEERPFGNEQQAVQRAKSYLQEGFAESISLRDLANEVSLSPYYFLRLFCAQVGMPPHTYLLNVRIRQAQRLIQLGQPLAEVAYAVGFSSQSHLTRRFKPIVGVTPGQYAAQMQPVGK